jgi:hypothetical protein
VDKVIVFALTIRDITRTIIRFKIIVRTYGKLEARPRARTNRHEIIREWIRLVWL